VLLPEYMPCAQSLADGLISIQGAVDMDIYGAFQLCSIGILAAPVTVRLSRTYFYDPGRNTIFAWTALILAGKRQCWAFSSPEKTLLIEKPF